MSEFGPELAAKVAATAKQNAPELAKAFGRAFDGTFAVDPGDGAAFDRKSLDAVFSGPGLVIALNLEQSGALLLVPESSGILPDWCQQPDPTGVSKLTTLAQELGMALLPEPFTVQDLRAKHVADLEIALDNARLAAVASILPFTLRTGALEGQMLLVWPANAVDDAFQRVPVADPAPATDAPPSEQADAQEQEPEQELEQDQEEVATGPLEIEIPASELPIPHYQDFESGVGKLTNYSRSLLKIKVPATVQLASTHLPISRILELAAGTIIQFDKSCEETLTLEVGNQEIAEGEVVKVGDKFGLRVTSMIMPQERLLSLRLLGR